MPQLYVTWRPMVWQKFKDVSKESKCTPSHTLSLTHSMITSLEMWWLWGITSIYHICTM
jgi:hypothetical protein